MPLVLKKTVFLLLVGLLVLQSYVLHKQGEPYPAILAPAFRAGHRGDSYTKPLILFSFSDGSVSTLSQTELLDQFPDSHHGALMRFFRPLPEERSERTRRLYELFPGCHKGRREIRENLPDAWNWFQIQSSRLFRRNDLSTVRVDWQIVTVADHRKIGTSGVYEVNREVAR